MTHEYKKETNLEALQKEHLGAVSVKHPKSTHLVAKNQEKMSHIESRLRSGSDESASRQVIPHTPSICLLIAIVIVIAIIIVIVIAIVIAIVIVLIIIIIVIIIIRLLLSNTRSLLG